MNDPRLLQLAPADNVCVLVKTLPAGETLTVSGKSIAVPERIGLGHKIAHRDIASGEKIIKYGVPIGSATRGIAAGEHVHLHNMKSDYMPTYTLDDGRQFVKAGAGH